MTSSNQNENIMSYPTLLCFTRRLETRLQWSRRFCLQSLPQEMWNNHIHLILTHFTQDDSNSTIFPCRIEYYTIWPEEGFGYFIEKCTRKLDSLWESWYEKRKNDNLSRLRSYICMSAVKTPLNPRGSQGRISHIPWHPTHYRVSSCMASVSGGQGVPLDQ